MAIIFLIVFGLFLIGMATKGLKSGTLAYWHHSEYTDISEESKKSNPFGFWFLVVLHYVFGILALFFAYSLFTS